DGQGRLAVVPVDGEDPWLIPGVQPHIEAPAGWGEKSDSLYVHSLADVLPLRIDEVDLRRGRRKLFKEITPPELQAFGGIKQVIVAPGGKTYAYSYGQYPCILYVIE